MNWNQRIEPVRNAGRIRSSLNVAGANIASPDGSGNMTGASHRKLMVQNVVGAASASIAVLEESADATEITAAVTVKNVVTANVSKIAHL